MSYKNQKGVSYYVRLFNQRTSIRGISKLENSKYAVIKWFWGSFVVIAHIVMIALVVFLVLRYLAYDRVLKTTGRMVAVDDFPEVTICSKFFFDMGKEIPDPFVILNDYIKEVNKSIAVTIDNGEYAEVIRMMKYDYLTQSFFHKHFDFIRSRTVTLATQSTKKCRIRSTNDNTLYHKTAHCDVREIYNPLYLNCLAFRIPKNVSSELSTNNKMTIKLSFLRKPKDAFIHRFRIDETVNNLEGSFYQSVKVYINKVNDYPFHHHYEVPFKCDQDNEYIVEKIEGIVSNKDGLFAKRSDHKCQNEETQANSFGMAFSSTREHLCRYLAIQERLIRTCNCFRSHFPKDNTSNSTAVPCTENYDLITCYAKVFASSKELPDSSCLPSCSQTDFAVTHKYKSIYNSRIGKIKDIISEIEVCKENRTERCKTVATCMLKELYESVSEPKCQAIFEEMPETSTKNESDPYDCSKVRFTLEMRPMVTVNTESLVVEINTLLSQISGICAFFTGLTFTFIAEVIETVIIWRIGNTESI